MKKLSSLAVILALLVGLSGCGQATLPQRFQAQFLTLFDTVTTIVAYGTDQAAFQEQAQFIHDRLEEYHQLYNIYQDYPGVTNLKTINDHAGIAPVFVDQRIIDLLVYAQEMEHLTDGYVNVAMGSVLSIWHDYRTAGMEDPSVAQLPPMELLRRADEHTAIENMIIDQQSATVYLSDPELRLDVGAIAKGYAVERVCQEAVEAGFSSCLVSVGGNVYAVGAKDETGMRWNVGVSNPWGNEEGEEENLLSLGLADQALVTSGVYQRYYTVDGMRYHHIIAPDTLMPSDRFEAVTILCDDSGLADALSTAVFNMPFEQGLRLVESIPTAEAMWVYPDQSVQYSAGFASYILENNIEA